jgi:hypothetical protein
MYPFNVRLGAVRVRILTGSGPYGIRAASSFLGVPIVALFGMRVCGPDELDTMSLEAAARLDGFDEGGAPSLDYASFRQSVHGSTRLRVVEIPGQVPSVTPWQHWIVRHHAGPFYIDDALKGIVYVHCGHCGWHGKHRKTRGSWRNMSAEQSRHSCS